MQTPDSKSFDAGAAAAEEGGVTPARSDAGIAAQGRPRWFHWKTPNRFWWEFLRWAVLLALLLAGQLSWVVALCLLAWGAGAFLFAARSGFAVWVGWPLAFAGLLGVQCVVQTPPSVRQHDVEGHREYVDFVSTHARLPAVQQGWETWQPPLYYLLAAAWRGLFSEIPHDDPFRSVQFLAAVLYLCTVTLALRTFRRLHLSDLEALGALGILALVPGNLFFAARINNDVLLPLLGGGVLLATTQFVESGEGRWLAWLSLLMAAALATKGSSLALAGGALLVVFGSELRRSNWRMAFWRAYLTSLPAALWQIFWWTRNAAQTGDPLYVNAALPDDLRVLVSPWHRLLSFHLGAFLATNFYYDDPMRQSYFTALVTSLLYGEYAMGDTVSAARRFFAGGALGVVLILIIGALVPPRRELRPAWIICLCLAGCQAAITVSYAIKFPYACNQNVRFFAQAFVPFSGLFGFGVGRLWSGFGGSGRVVLLSISAVFLVGLADFYLRLLF